MNQLITTKEAAEIAGLTDGRIRQLVLAGVLPAKKIGRDLLIKPEDLKILENRVHGNRKKAA